MAEPPTRLSSLAAGSHALSVVYSGDSIYATSTSLPSSITINQAPSFAGSLVSSQPQTFYGQDVTLTATFSSTASANGAPMTGTVQFYDGSIYLGSAPLLTQGSPAARLAGPMEATPLVSTVSGEASLPTSALGVGDHIITAIYSGDANYAGAVSETPVSVQVVPATTATSLTSSTTPEGTTLTADVFATSPGTPTLVGTVSFYNGSTLLGTAPVTNGVATLFLGVVSPGNYAYSAVFSGGGTSTTSGGSLQVLTSGAAVTRVATYGFLRQRKFILLSFNTPLDATSAQGCLQLLAGRPARADSPPSALGQDPCGGLRPGHLVGDARVAQAVGIPAGAGRSSSGARSRAV